MSFAIGCPAAKREKNSFSLFDFFAVVEYFERDHEYNEKLSLDLSDENEDGAGDNDGSGETPPEEKPKTHTHTGRTRLHG